MVDDDRPQREARLLPTVVAAGVALAVAVGVVAYAAGHYTNRVQTLTETVGAPASALEPAGLAPDVMAGAHAFVQFACAECHGMQGRGGVDPAVPALSTIKQTLTETQLTQIIDHGLGVSSDPTRPYMPVWGEVISKTQVHDLVAYIRAGLPNDPNALPPVVPDGETPAIAGSILYFRFGCINCHGPNGLGGVPNPLSEDKAIPPLVGQDFRNEFPDSAIADMIRSGSVIGEAPIVSMPHWGGILSNQQIAQLVAYLKTLK
jgi:mono/diheme cytochrome c family protein